MLPKSLSKDDMPVISAAGEIVSYLLDAKRGLLRRPMLAVDVLGVDAMGTSAGTVTVIDFGNATGAGCTGVGVFAGSETGTVGADWVAGANDAMFALLAVGVPTTLTMSFVPLTYRVAQCVTSLLYGSSCFHT